MAEILPSILNFLTHPTLHIPEGWVHLNISDILIWVSGCAGCYVRGPWGEQIENKGQGCLEYDPALVAAILIRDQDVMQRSMR